MMHILFSNVGDPSQLSHRSVRFLADQAAQIGQAIGAGISGFCAHFLAEPMPKLAQAVAQLFYFVKRQAPAFKFGNCFVF